MRWLLVSAGIGLAAGCSGPISEDPVSASFGADVTGGQEGIVPGVGGQYWGAVQGKPRTLPPDGAAGAPLGGMGGEALGGFGGEP